MKKIFNWIKNHILASVLLVILVVIFLRNNATNMVNLKMQSSRESYDTMNSDFGVTAPNSASKNYGVAPQTETDSYRKASNNQASEEGETASQPVDPGERKVITNSRLSITVNEVNQSMKNIKQEAENSQGFLVNSQLSQKSNGDTGTIIVKVHSDHFESFMEKVRNMAVKIVSEHTDGRDITDQYTDLEERLRIIQETKERFSDIFNQAEEVDEMLNVQRELLSLQRQIDNIKGRMQYLDKSSEYATVTVYLSTDELALPEMPEDKWRPAAVYRNAKRALINTLQDLASIGIWVAVFVPIWITIIIVVIIAKKVISVRKKQSQSGQKSDKNVVSSLNKK